MIKWGIIGAGNIAHRFAESLTHFEDAELYCIGCRTREKAEAFQKMHSCKKAVIDYNLVLDDADVDAVYISLPHLYHYEWTMKALRSGKAVLCEKPATMSSQEMQDIMRLSNSKSVLFMEAMKSRFVPCYRQMYQRIKSGEIGQIYKIHTSLCRTFSKEASSYHFLPLQGGALRDMGIYNISLIQNFSPQNLRVASCESIIDENQVDRYVCAKLVGDGFEASVETGFDRTKDAEAVIYGTKGTITISNFHRPISYTLSSETNETTIQIPYQYDDFYSEIDAFKRTFNKKENQNDVMTLQDSVDCAELVEKIRLELR